LARWYVLEEVATAGSLGDGRSGVLGEPERLNYLLVLPLDREGAGVGGEIDFPLRHQLAIL
jgi:hypothetical protein